MFDTSCYFVIYQQFLRYHFALFIKHATSSQKHNLRLHFSPLPTYLRTSLSLGGSSEVTSVGCNWLISIHVVDFVEWKLCLGGPGYSSRTITRLLRVIAGNVFQRFTSPLILVQMIQI